MNTITTRSDSAARAWVHNALALLEQAPAGA